MIQNLNALIRTLSDRGQHLRIRHDIHGDYEFPWSATQAQDVVLVVAGYFQVADAIAQLTPEQQRILRIMSVGYHLQKLDPEGRLEEWLFYGIPDCEEQASELLAEALLHGVSEEDLRNVYFTDPNSPAPTSQGDERDPAYIGCITDA